MQRPKNAPLPESGLLGWSEFLDARRRDREDAGLRRQRRVASADGPVHTVVVGQRLLQFCSNDYLGLAHHPEVMAAMQTAAKRWGAGSGAASLVSGYGPEHHALEQELADFLQRESVLLLSSGYLANLAVATALADRHGAIVQDRLAHASLIDAARLSGAKLLRYAHNDVAAAERQLHQAEGRRCMLVTDGIFSMDGDAAPVAELTRLAAEHGALLVVDDAHGIGVCGDDGRGITAGFSSPEVPLLVGTLGKALGAAGAFIAGDRDWIEHIANEARSYLFNTALPPAVAAAARQALRLVRSEPQRRERLHGNVETFRHAAKGLPLLDSASPIQPLLIGPSARASQVSERLQARGYLVPAIRPPTVPEGSARLRVALSSEHSEEQILALVAAIRECLD